MSKGPKVNRRDDLGAKFGAMYDELQAWRAEHPDAGVDEIFAQITPRRRELMGELMLVLAVQNGNERCPEVLCEECGARMVYKGEAPRGVEHLEGEVELLRAYFHCPHCEGGVFPPGPETEAGQAQLDA